MSNYGDYVVITAVRTLVGLLRSKILLRWSMHLRGGCFALQGFAT